MWQQDGQFNRPLVWKQAICRVRERERMLPTRRKVSILMPLGLPLDVLQNSLWICNSFSVIAPLVISCVSNVLGGVAYDTCMCVGARSLVRLLEVVARWARSLHLIPLTFILMPISSGKTGVLSINGARQREKHRRLFPLLSRVLEATARQLPRVLQNSLWICNSFSVIAPLVISCVSNVLGGVAYDTCMCVGARSLVRLLEVVARWARSLHLIPLTFILMPISSGKTGVLSINGARQREKHRCLFPLHSRVLEATARQLECTPSVIFTCADISCYALGSCPPLSPHCECLVGGFISKN